MRDSSREPRGFFSRSTARSKRVGSDARAARDGTRETGRSGTYVHEVVVVAPVVRAGDVEVTRDAGLDHGGLFGRRARNNEKRSRRIERSLRAARKRFLRGRRKPRSEKAREVGFRAVSSPGERAFQNRASIGEQEIPPALTGRAGSLRRRSRNSFARQILGARGVGRVSGVADRRLSQLLPGDRSAGCAGRTFPASDRERRGRTERYVPHSVYPVLRLNAHCAGIII